MNHLNSLDDIKILEVQLGLLRMSGWTLLFRGQSDISWPIVSTLSRCIGNRTIDKVWDTYLGCYNEFKEYASKLELNTFKPAAENEDFFYLSIARHLELPSHILDWTSSLETALFFGTNENEDSDGVLWILATTNLINESPITKSPFDYACPNLTCKVFDLLPTDNYIADLPLGRLRRSRQNGFFSMIPRNYLNQPFENLLTENERLIKVVLSTNFKREFVEHCGGIKENHLYCHGNCDEDENEMISFVSSLSNKIKI